MQVAISARHGHLGETVQSYIEEKADRLSRFFDRLTRISVTVDLQNAHPKVEIIVSAEHKRDFVAHDEGSDVLAAVDAAIQKMEQQLRKYKEKLHDHRRTPAQGDTTA